MKNHPLVTRSLVLVLIALWLTGTLQVRGSALSSKLPPSISGQTSVSTSSALGTAFTYQGLLKDGSGNPVTNTCGFQFGLYDALSGGSLVTGTTLQTVTPVTVTNGYFTVSLDFGATAFNGSARWLDIAVRCPTGSGSYTTLSPRQPLTPAPYALYAVNAGTSAHLSGVLPLANGGTGSATQNFVDLSTAQTMGGAKTFSSAPSFNAAGAPFNVTSSSLVSHLNADQLDGKHASAFQQHYQNVLVVAKSGGDYSTITAALNSITTASATNPWLIYVAPGIYAEMVVMKIYVDIEGAGEQATKITYANSSSNTGTVYGTSDAELRFLTVENTGGSAYAIAIYNTGYSRLTHVTATASGGTTQNIGVYNMTSSPTMTNVTATARGGAGTYNYGVYNFNLSSPVMTNVTASASLGTNSNGVYNINSSSPAMTDMTATASLGTNNRGVFNSSSSSPAMTNVTAIASAGTNNYGVYNSFSSPTMMGLNVTVSGGTNNYGMWNDSSAPTIQNSVISVLDTVGSVHDGIYNTASSGYYTVTINNSRITGSTDTIYSDSSRYTTQLGASQLIGSGVQGSGNYTCIFSYDGSFVALNSICQ